MSEAAFYHISQETGLKQISSIDEAIKKTGQGGYMWFDFDNPTIEQISPVIEPLGIHPLSIEDCFDDNQVPKIDLFPKHSFFLFNNYSYDKKLFSVDEIDFVLSSNYLLTVHGYKAADKDFFNKLRAYVVSGASKSNLSSGPDFLMHLILDFIVDHKFDAIEMLQEELDEKEEIILNGEEAFRPQTLIHLRKHLLSLRKSLFHEREVLIRICRRDSPFISEKAIFYFRDIYDHLAKFFEYVEINREMVGTLYELHLSLIDSRLAKISNHTNTVMKRLTGITTIFMPLTLLAGVLGMSEWSMMTGPDNWKFAYPIFLIICVLLGVANYFVLKWLRWF